MERLTRGKNAEEVAKTVIRLLKPLKKHVKSITTDNGGEFAKHKHCAIYLVLSYGEPTDTKHQHSSEVKYAKQQNQQTNYSHIDYRRIDNYQYDSDRCNIFYSEQQVLVY